MYLCDKNILLILPELNFETNNPSISFDPHEQIQPSSIDLRLSNVFWIPQRAKAIDLRKSALLELAPRRYWKKRVLAQNECITLYPGRLLLACIYEEFTIPKECAGKIEGRSSFARMGLGVHCTGEYINPGYRGHMPLELYNFSPNPIRVFPYIPICQLMLIRLTGIPNRVYGETDLQSKYMNDDGGPSYWWRDKRIRSLQEAFMIKSVELEVQEGILKRIGIQEPEIIERFEKCLEHLKEPDKENADTLLEKFAENEDRLRKRHSAFKGCILALFPTLASLSGASILMGNYGILHYIIWVLMVPSLFMFIRALREPPMKYMGKGELEELLK